MQTSMGAGFRIGSKTVVKVLLEDHTQTFPTGTEYFEVHVGDKKILCFMEQGINDMLRNGTEPHTEPLLAAYKKPTKRKRK
jgi:hypothetical protein